MPLPLAGIALGSKIIGGIASGIGAKKQADADRKLSAEQYALERYDKLRGEARDNQLTDEDRAYKRSQQAAMNPVRGQLYGAMAAKLGLPAQAMAPVQRMMNPNATRNIGPTQVAPAARTPMPAVVDPEKAAAEDNLRKVEALIAKGGPMASAARKVLPQLQMAMNAKFGGAR